MSKSTPSASGPALNPEADQLLRRIAQEFDGLSRQLKLIARHVEQHRDHIGLERIQDVAERCGVQPSAVIRFAKHFGYSGYSEMQKIFRDGIAQRLAPGRNYQARIRNVIEQAEGRLSTADIAHEFIGGSISGLQQLQRDLHGTVLADAVDLLAEAPAIWIVGTRRSFSVAAYLAYAMQHTDKQVQFVTGLGNMHEDQLRSLRAGDVMIAITFSPYAEETLACTRLAAERGAQLIVITDSRMGPLAALPATLLIVQESSTFGFRALTNTLCLAQSLFIALAYQLELDTSPRR